MTAPNLFRLRSFVTAFAEMVDAGISSEQVIANGAELLGALVAADDWLPEAFGRDDPTSYRQYLLHCDSRRRFSIVSFVWGPGQSTPIHDHGVWGLVGVLRGAELVQSFARDAEGALRATADPYVLAAGAVEAIDPKAGDIHRVANLYDDRVSISIHIYGADIGAVRRSTYDAAGRPKPFISGYANRILPNIWGEQE